jgi:uncharacterized protein YcfJ
MNTPLTSASLKLRFLALGLSLACTGAHAQATTSTTNMSPAQIKAQQDMVAAQAAMDKANKEAAADKLAADKARISKSLADCTSCGTVTAVSNEKRKGSGGAMGIVGGAVAGGLLGHQVGGGTGKTLTTVGGAAAGAAVGNEIQKRMNKKTIHITTIQMKDGSVKKFESESAPSWKVGDAVKLDAATNSVSKL